MVLEAEERRQVVGGYERKMMGRRCTASEGIQCTWTELQAAMGAGPGGQRKSWAGRMGTSPQRQVKVGPDEEAGTARHSDPEPRGGEGQEPRWKVEKD